MPDLGHSSYLVGHPDRVRRNRATSPAIASRRIHGDFDADLRTGLFKERFPAVVDVASFDVSRELIPARAVGMGPARSDGAEGYLTQSFSNLYAASLGYGALCALFGPFRAIRD